MFKTQQRRPRKPVWFFARAALVTAALFFAAFTVTFWALDLWETSPALACFVAGGFALSALVTPTVVPKLAHAQGGQLIGLFIVCLVFGAVDTVGLDKAFSGLEARITEKDYSAALAARNSQLAPLTATIAAETGKRDAVTLTERGCLCPQTRAADLEAFERQRKAHQLLIDTAKVEMEAVEMPVRRQLFDRQLMFWLSLGLQVALAVGLLSVEAARERVYAQAVAAYEARLEAQRKARAKASAKAAPKRRKPTGFTAPTLVVSND